MAAPKKNPDKNGQRRSSFRDSLANTQVTFRLPKDLRAFYEKKAERDRRRLSDTLRIALEDRAKQLAEEVAA